MTPEERMATLEAKLEQQIKEIDGLRSDIMAAPAVPAYPSGTTDICGNPL